MKVTALFCYVLNMEHIFRYTEIKDNDYVYLEVANNEQKEA